MVTLTAELAKQGYIDNMGEPLGTQFAELWQQVAHLHLKWLEYVELYGTNQKRFDPMNQAAPNFFKMVGEMMYRDTLLHIARYGQTEQRAGEASAHIPQPVAACERPERPKRGAGPVCECRGQREVHPGLARPRLRRRSWPRPQCRARRGDR